MKIEKKKYNRLGFTLVELVIVIAIVIVLSVVSVPIYRGYVDKAKMSEGYALLGLILSAQKAYYSEYGNFLDDWQSDFAGGNYANVESVLGIDARGNKYFTWFWYDTNASVLSKYFVAYAVLPPDLKKGSDTALGLQYNVSRGVRYFDSPSGFDTDWKN